MTAKEYTQQALKRFHAIVGLGGSRFDQKRYISACCWIPLRDGVRIAVSALSKLGKKRVTHKECSIHASRETSRDYPKPHFRYAGRALRKISLSIVRRKSVSKCVKNGLENVAVPRKFLPYQVITRKRDHAKVGMRENVV